MTISLSLVAVAVLLFMLAGCGYADSEASPAEVKGDKAPATSSMSESQSAPPTEIQVSEPDTSTESEEIAVIPWGGDDGELSMGESQFGTSGPDMMAVSPDGKIIAVLDRYAEVPRINFYTGGVFVSDLRLEDIPLAIVIDNQSVTYALYQEVPTSRVVCLAPSGTILNTILIPGDLDPVGVFWAGSDLFAEVAVGGTEDSGHLCVMYGDGEVPNHDQTEVRGDITKQYPTASGEIALKNEGTGSWMVSQSAEKETARTVRLLLPPSLEDAAMFPFGSLGDGTPVLMAFKSFDDGRSSVGHYVAVDFLTASVKTATVSFTWRVPGGMAAVGPDAIFVMSLDKASGVHILRVPFR